MTLLTSYSRLASFLKALVLFYSFSFGSTEVALAAEAGLAPVPQSVEGKALVNPSDSLFTAVMTGSTSTRLKRKVTLKTGI